MGIKMINTSKTIDKCEKLVLLTTCVACKRINLQSKSCVKTIHRFSTRIAGRQQRIDACKPRD